MMVGGASGTAQRVGEGGNLYSICSDTVEKATTYHPQP